ncbi:MAG: hypothetical protein ACRELY_09975, partial [Polyangiaceae bacterium]
YQTSLATLSLLRSGKAEALPLGVATSRPSLIEPVGNTLFLVADTTDPDPTNPDTTAHLLSYDLTSLALTNETTLSTCDTNSILARKGCLP